MSADPPLASPRSRLDSFRAQQGRTGPPLAAPQSAAPAGDGFQIQMPGAGGGAPSIPGLGLSSMSSGQAAAGADPSGRPLSSRRLKKEILKADSKSAEASNSAGHITLRDEMGTPRSVRVVQREAIEDFNMVSVKWVCTDTLAFQVELRHGRKSGIRKIYVNKELVLRTKTIANLLADRGSVHDFDVGGRRAQITIERGRSSNFTYHLSVDNEEIERDIGISAAGLAGELGTHFVCSRLSYLCNTPAWLPLSEAQPSRAHIHGLANRARKPRVHRSMPSPTDRPRVHRASVHRPRVHRPRVHRPRVHRPRVHRPRMLTPLIWSRHSLVTPLTWPLARRVVAGPPDRRR